MKNERKEFVSKYKYYHTIILGLILSSFLILNSNYVNNQRAQNKLNIEKSRLFDKIISGRNLKEMMKKNHLQIKFVKKAQKN